MEKKLPIGYDNFKEVIEKDLYYVDKKHVIEELLDNKNKVVLFPRPRRFDKTLLLSMLENFFNIEKKKIISIYLIIYTLKTVNIIIKKLLY